MPKDMVGARQVGTAVEAHVVWAQVVSVLSD